MGLQATGSGGTAVGWLDAGQSVYWDGIATVTTRDDAAVDDTVTALSGVDCRVSFAPIPEPATVLLLAPGLDLPIRLVARRRAALA
jgi:hypothetical protein